MEKESPMLDAIKNRRSIRKYESRPVEEDAIAQLKEAALRAPSSRNLQPWRIVFVTDPETLGLLSTAKAQYASFLADAPLGIVVCGNDAKSDCWIEDCSIVATVLQLTATSLSLGSCWIQIRGREDAEGSSSEGRVLDILGLPAGLRVLTVLAVGYPAEEKPPLPAEKLAWEKVE
jgi:nitroreductase